MRVTVIGDNENAMRVQSMLRSRTFEVTQDPQAPADYTLLFDNNLTNRVDIANNGAFVIVDGVDCELEREVVKWIAALLEDSRSGIRVLLERAGGVRSDRALRIILPKAISSNAGWCVEHGVVAALEHLALRDNLRTTRPNKQGFFKKLFQRR